MDPAEVIKKLLGPAADELAEMWKDRIRLYRYEQHIRLVQKAARLAHDAEFTPTAVPLKILLPLMEGASPEEDAALHDMWAALLKDDSLLETPPQSSSVSVDLQGIEAKVSLSVPTVSVSSEAAFPSSPLLIRVVDLSPSILNSLRENPDRIRQLSPQQFEIFVANCLERMGFNVSLTGPTNRKDGGIDLIAVPKVATLGSIVIGGQVKHHRGDQKTGRDAVDRLLAWKNSDFGVGLLVTNTEFTRDALWAADPKRSGRFLRLRSSSDLKLWLEDNFGDERNWRELPISVELAPGVTVSIPKPTYEDALDTHDSPMKRRR